MLLGQCVLYKSAIKAKLPCQTTLQPESWWVYKAPGSSTCQGVRGTRGSPLSMHAPSLQERGLWRKLYGVVQTGAVQMLCYQCLGARQTCHNMCDAWNVYCVGAKSERRFLCFSCRAETDGKCLHAAVLRGVGPTMSYRQLQWLPGGCGHKLQFGLAAAKWSGRDQQLLRQECIMLYQ